VNFHVGFHVPSTSDACDIVENLNAVEVDAAACNKQQLLRVRTRRSIWFSFVYETFGGFEKVSCMRMTMTDSSTCGVDSATDETSRGNNLRNVVVCRRSTPIKKFESGLRSEVISHIKTLNYLSGLFMLGVVSGRVLEFYAIPRSG
jgi:hypothetical protein